eukprot:4395432-Pyramimonas_sp.AAC.1
MRLPRPEQRFVAPWGAPPKAPVAQSACVSPAQDSVSWHHREPSPPFRHSLTRFVGSTAGLSGGVPKV